MTQGDGAGAMEAKRLRGTLEQLEGFHLRNLDPLGLQEPARNLETAKLIFLVLFVSPLSSLPSFRFCFLGSLELQWTPWNSSP